jgi:hypothetical protein
MINDSQIPEIFSIYSLWEKGTCTEYGKPICKGTLEDSNFPKRLSITIPENNNNHIIKLGKVLQFKRGRSSFRRILSLDDRELKLRMG